MSLIQLKQWDIEYVPPGNVVDTGGLGPCIGVILYNKEAHTAYAGHFLDVRMDGLETMVKNALSRFQDPASLEVYVAGNSIGNEEDAEYFVNDRKFVTDLLRSHDLINTYIRWSPPNTGAHLILNVDSGKNELEILQHYGDQLIVLYRGDIRKAPDPIPVKVSLKS